MHRILLSCVLLLCSCTAAPADGSKAESAAASTPDATGGDWTVTLQVSSWGKLMWRWQVNDDGTGEEWRVPQSSLHARYEIQKFRFRIDKAALPQFAEASDRLRAATRKEIACRYTKTDTPYGNVVWRNGSQEQTFVFNLGCTSPEADAAYDLMDQTSDAMKRLAQVDSRPYATERVPSPN